MHDFLYMEADGKCLWLKNGDSEIASRENVDLVVEEAVADDALPAIMM